MCLNPSVFRKPIKHMLNFNDGSCTEAYKAKLPLNLDNVPFLFLSKKKKKNKLGSYMQELSLVQNKAFQFPCANIRN